VLTPELSLLQKPVCPKGFVEVPIKKGAEKRVVFSLFEKKNIVHFFPKKLFRPGKGYKSEKKQD